MRFGARRPKTNHVIVLNARGSWFTCGPYSGDVKGQSISLSVGVDPLLEYPTRSLAEPEPHPRKICAIISPNAHPISILRSNTCVWSCSIVCTVSRRHDSSVLSESAGQFCEIQNVGHSLRPTDAASLEVQPRPRQEDRC